MLVEFASPINAVQCAVDIRTALALAGQGDERPFRMRFGLRSRQSAAAITWRHVVEWHD